MWNTLRRCYYSLANYTTIKKDNGDSKRSSHWDATLMLRYDTTLCTRLGNSTDKRVPYNPTSFSSPVDDSTSALFFQVLNIILRRYDFSFRSNLGDYQRAYSIKTIQWHKLKKKKRKKRGKEITFKDSCFVFIPKMWGAEIVPVKG
ncbi:hypothetical protein POVCU2_0017960 [Plasmodium ovale curtisi]|nr:hypothetical protein POVCU2_0017960 [Plasmodium ovale curtisi]